MSRRILIVHNHYQQLGGEDAVVANEQALLTAYGNTTKLWTVSNDIIVGLGDKLRTAWLTTYSHKARQHMRQLIAAFAPDLVHVHNFFPLLSPSIYDACAEEGVPVIQSLHNYRTICPGALLLRDGQPCETCITGSPYHAVLHGCYRSSRFGSLAVAHMVAVHRRRATWQTKVAHFIALSDFARRKFISAGFPAHRITVKPNFAPDTGVGNDMPRHGALFVGRISQEKGIVTLLQAWSGLDVPLRVVGDGPLAGQIWAAADRPITMLGWQSPACVASEMAHAAFLVLPSEWYENFPVIIAEAFCHGLPVIASRIGAMADLVNDGVTGLHFTPGNSADLAEKIRWAHSNPDAMRWMGVAARRKYEENYTPEANYKIITEIYDTVISNSTLAFN